MFPTHKDDKTRPDKTFSSSLVTLALGLPSDRFTRRECVWKLFHLEMMTTHIMQVCLHDVVHQLSLVDLVRQVHVVRPHHLASTLMSDSPPSLVSTGCPPRRGPRADPRLCRLSPRTGRLPVGLSGWTPRTGYPPTFRYLNGYTPGGTRSTEAVCDPDHVDNPVDIYLPLTIQLAQGESRNGRRGRLSTGLSTYPQARGPVSPPK